MYSVDVNLKGVPVKIRKICKDPRVGKFMAMEFYRKMVPYVPMDTGTLYRDVDINEFEVYYKQHYAERVYKGTHLNFSKEKHPNATSYWDKAMLKAHKQEIVRSVTKFIERM